MDKLRLLLLENLLRVKGNPSNEPVSDTSILSCGCLVSEAYFNNLATPVCPACQTHNVTLVAEIEPLRQLSKLVFEWNQSTKDNNSKSLRRSTTNIDPQDIQSREKPESNVKGELMNLLSMFYKYAQEEIEITGSSSTPKKLEKLDKPHNLIEPNSTNLITIEPSTDSEIPRSSAVPIPSGTPAMTSSTSTGTPHSVESLSSSVFRTLSIQPGRRKLLSASPSSLSISPLNQNYLAKSETSIKYNPNTIIGSSNDVSNQYIEQREYNFSKCFPFYRKVSIFPTQQVKLNLSSLSNFRSSSVMKKASKFIGSSIFSYIDPVSGVEITRFVLITDKKWEVYEYKDSSEIGVSKSPKLICCGKLSGEYGSNYSELIKRQPGDDEIVIRNDFGGTSSSNATSRDDTLSSNTLNSWEQIYCCLSSRYLVISGTKGIMRVFNMAAKDPKQLGKPIYTYFTNFPIRCISISPDESVIACGITARERVSNKEQPFIIIHKLNRDLKGCLKTVEPITITIPYRDPIKFIKFNSSSNFLVCCTSWESRYLIIRLSGSSSENFRKPRLIWSDTSYPRKRSVDQKETVGLDFEKTSEDSDRMMWNEGVTDIQFGAMNANLLIITSCSLTNRPPIFIRLDGGSLEGHNQGRSASGGTAIGLEMSSLTSKNDSNNDEDHFSNISFNTNSINNAGNGNNNGNNNSSSIYANNSNKNNLMLTSSEVLMKLQEVGSEIHRVAVLPRGDGIVFLSKSGNIYLVSIPKFQLHPTSQMKKIVLQLGETSNAERFRESSSITFSKDGGKIFTVDRKGVFQVFDFTKGIPGRDVEIVKCKIVHM